MQISCKGDGLAGGVPDAPKCGGDGRARVVIKAVVVLGGRVLRRLELLELVGESTHSVRM